jgi:hypothetical protein
MTDQEHPEEAPDPIVRIGYSASSNISFNGTLETGYRRSEWNKLSQKSKNEVQEDLLWELIDLFELEDDQPDYTGRSFR